MAVGDVETKISYKFLKWVLYGLLLTPLLVWSVFLFPFITTKVLYFRILVEIAVFLYVILAIRYPEIRPRWKNWLTRLVWLYFAVVVIASVFGVDFSTSFWGTVERGEGIITLFHFVLYFTILSAVFRTRQEWLRYLTAALLVILYVAVYGYVQLQCFDRGLEPGAQGTSGICSSILPTQGTRVSASIGNAAFFAAFLLFGIVFALYLLQYAAGGRKRRIFLYAALLFLVYMLLQSQTRGAAVAMYLVLLLFLIFYIFLSKKTSKRIVGALVLLFLIVMPIVIYAKPTWLPARFRGAAIISRLTRISLSDITTQSRLDTWQASFKGWKDRLTLGYGYENYNIAFNKYFPARVYKDRGSQIWFDRAHNVVFDIGVTSGIVGLAAYLSIFAAAAVFLLKLLRRSLAALPGLKWPMPVILLLALVAYLLQNFFVFDTQATYLMFFLLLAHIVFLKQNYDGVLEKQKRGIGNSYRPGFFLPSVLAALLIISLNFVNVRPALANYRTSLAIRTALLEQYPQLKAAFERALSYGTYMDIEIRQRLVDYGLEALGSGRLSQKERSELHNYMISEFEKSLQESPKDVKNYLYLMNVLNRFPENPGALKRVFELGGQALELSPTRPQIYYEIAQAAFFGKEFDRGLEYFRKAIELNPRPKDSHVNYLIGLIIAEREDLAAEELKVITQELGYQLELQDYLSFARAYMQAGNKPKVIEIYKLAVELEPTNTEILAKLAAAYGEVCDLQNTEAIVDRVVELNSAFVLQGRQFMAQLAAKCQEVIK